MHRLRVYWKIWFIVAKNTFQEVFLNRWANALFIFGKLVRFGMLLLFLLLLQKNISHLAGYSIDEVMVFFLTYQFLDTVAQVFYRGVYHFSNTVRTGEMDFYLSKPVNPLFRILTDKPDFLDIVFFFPTTAISLWIIFHLHVAITLASILSYLLLLINSFFIVTALHILVVSLGVVTTEVDNAILLYRDFTNMSRFPVNIYGQPFRAILFFLVPVGLMNTIPSQVLLNLKPSVSILLTILVGGGFLLFSLRVWKWAVKNYTSAGG